MNTFSFVSHYLYRCSNRKIYLLRRLTLVGCISIIFMMWISEANMSAGRHSRVGLEIFSAISFALYIFIILFIPVFASKLINDDKEQGVLPLLMISKIPTMSLIWYKYAAFIVLISIHGSATLPVFLMCTHVGGIGAEQILATYLILFGYSSAIASAVICITARRNFSMTEALFSSFALSCISELLAYNLEIPISPMSQMGLLLQTNAPSSYIDFSLVCMAISLFFLFITGKNITVFSGGKGKYTKKFRAWLLKRYKLTKNFSRNNFLLRREERRQVFQVTHAFCRFVSVVAMIGWLPVINFFVLPIVALCALFSLTLYAASCFAVDSQEIELLRLTAITPETFLENKRRALNLSISPLSRFVHGYVASSTIFLIVLIGIYMWIWGFIVGMIYVPASFLLVRIALFCSARYRVTATALVYTSIIFCLVLTCLSFIFTFLVVFLEPFILFHCLLCFGIILYIGKVFTALTLNELKNWSAQKKV